MLTEKQVKCLLVLRLQAALGSCNSRHIDHCSGQVRALMAVLQRPLVTTDACEVLDMAGIPYTRQGDGFLWDNDWLREHGFVFDPDDEFGQVIHPDFPAW